MRGWTQVFFQICQSSSAVVSTELLLPPEDGSSGLAPMATEGVWRAVLDGLQGGLDDHLLSAVQRVRVASIQLLTDMGVHVCLHRNT